VVDGSVCDRIDRLAVDPAGPVYIDGGHGQFGVDYALSSEDAAYYQRHLEGRGINLEQINDVTLDRLSGARALVVTTPVEAFTREEVAAVRSFRDDGNAVVLLGSGAAPTDAIDNLNGLARALGTPIRVNDDQVRDRENNVAADPSIPTTTAIAIPSVERQDRGPRFPWSISWED